MITYDDIATQIFSAADSLRRWEGDVLGLLGLDPRECRYRIIAAGRGWRVRAYDGTGDGPALLIVAAPIKRPYIWDLAAEISPIRRCLARGVQVFLIEWSSPPGIDDRAGLDDFAGAIHEGAARVTGARSDGSKPFLMGHSLGGTIAAIHAALEPESLQGLILLGSPLCFRPGVGHFRDALVSLVPGQPSGARRVPGSLLSHLSALAAPETFVWSRAVDATLGMTDWRGAEIRARIERWALDEAPLPGRLAREILDWLYREDRFCRAVLSIRGRTIGPSCLRTPTLAVVNTSDGIAPLESVRHFLNAAPGQMAELLEYPGETGVCLQHLAVLVGRRAHEQLWPKILAWIDAHRRVTRSEDGRARARRGRAS